LIAAYFAVEPVARRRTPGTTPPTTEAPFSIFALHEAVFSATRGLDPWIVPIVVPSATNANLRAQGGMFSLVQPTAVDRHPLPDIIEALRDHEAKIASLAFGKFKKLFPLLIEFRVPAREARTVFRLLYQMGVDAAAVFPNLGGIARFLEEKRFHQTAPQGQRS
jgi:hypothetical protein